MNRAAIDGLLVAGKASDLPPTSTARSLSPAEEVVISYLLADEKTPQREQIRRAEVPARTFERIRKRAYDEGWVYDAYLPNLECLGRTLFSVRLIQPYLEHYRTVESRWSADPNCVVLWRWPESLFAVFSLSPAAVDGADFVGPTLARSENGVRAEIPTGGVPIYFDFAGVWSQLAGLSASGTYPRGPYARSGSQPRAGEVSERAQRAVQVFLRRVAEAHSRHEWSRGGAVRLTRAERRSLSSGMVTRKVLLDLPRAPRTRVRHAESVAFIQGVLVPGVRPSGLFRQLARIRVFPFLFVHDGTTVFLATLSARPPVRFPGEARPAVLATLQSCLSSLEIVRQPLATLSVLTDHRYDRVVPVK